MEQKVGTSQTRHLSVTEMTETYHFNRLHLLQGETWRELVQTEGESWQLVSERLRVKQGNDGLGEETEYRSVKTRVLSFMPLLFLFFCPLSILFIHSFYLLSIYLYMEGFPLFHLFVSSCPAFKSTPEKTEMKPGHLFSALKGESKINCLRSLF